MAKEVLDKYFLAITALVTIAYQLFFFAIAWTFKFDKVTDLAGGSNFIILAVLTASLRGSSNTDLSSRNAVATAFVIVWGIRTAGFLFWRILKTGTDARFDEMREKFWSFAGFWVFQMIWVWGVSLPLTILNSPYSLSATSRSPFGTALDIIGTILWGIGILTETISDIQKLNFRNSNPPSQNNRPFMQTGLFRYSRHPNYFGEMLHWIGIYLICLSPTQPTRVAQILTIFSPLLTISLLMFLSGLPLNEKPVARKRFESSVKHGGNGWGEYKEYLNRTSILIPFPPGLYRKLPGWVKHTIFLEFGMYRFDPEREAGEQDREGLTGGDGGGGVSGSGSAGGQEISTSSVDHEEN
ncbi:hypothetical protein DFH27DRAFT_583044 [Peziza echinospora]|nr:hypothetical protein DFH27DRAFT_583044 [Peziza echinospora]